VEFNQWLQQLPGSGVLAAYPAGFDFTFLRYYLHRFAGESTLACLDMKTLAMALLRRPYHKCWKGKFPRRWMSTNPFPHHALEDAIAQGKMLAAMLADLDKMQAALE